MPCSLPAGQYIIDPAATFVTLPSMEMSPRALGHDHDFLLRMLVRRMGRHAGFELQAARRYAAHLVGAAVEIDAQITERFVRGRGVMRQLRGSGQLLRGGGCCDRIQSSEFEEVASIGHVRIYHGLSSGTARLRRKSMRRFL